MCHSAPETILVNRSFPLIIAAARDNSGAGDNTGDQGGDPLSRPHSFSGRRALRPTGEGIVFLVCLLRKTIMTQKHRVRKNIGKGTHKEFALGYAMLCTKTKDELKQ